MFSLQLAPIGSTVLVPDLIARDADSGINGAVEYFSIPGDDSLVIIKFV